MLYFIIRPFTHLGLLAFCKKIYLSTAKSIPNDRPVILACNHPTAFLEPCIMASFLKHPLYFLVRGDFFKNSFYRRLMHSLHLIPIYRSTNANFKELKQNISILDEVGQQLNKNISLMILVEGSASIRKGLRPIQKGIARLAFETYEKYGRDDLEIIPVGANFDYPTEFRMTGLIHLGEALPIRDYLHLYRENEKKAIRKLMQDIQAGMRQNIIHIEKEADETLVEQQLLLYRNSQKEKRFPIIKRTSTRLKEEIQIAEQINQMETTEKDQLKQATSTYFDILKTFKLSDATVGKPFAWWHLVVLILGLPIFIIGAAFNFFVPFFAYKIAEKNIKKIQYLMPVTWGISNTTYIIYWFILFAIALFLMTWYWSLLLLIIPILGYVAILYYELFQEWKQIARWQKCASEVQEQILKSRTIALSWSADNRVH